MRHNMYDDSFNDYFIVIEQAQDPQKPEIQFISKENDPLHFLRWRQKLQSAGYRNRNGRLWITKYLKMMTADSIVLEMIRTGWCGEAGHPVPDVGKVELTRILTIDPKYISHKVNSIEWIGNDLYGVMETLDDGPNGYGTKFMKNIMQGIEPAVSARTIIPQRKNADGTYDQIAPGRLVCYDRVFVPGHADAYIDKNVPVKNVTKKVEFETAIEQFNAGYAISTLSKSEKVKRIADQYSVVMESMTMNPNGVITMRDEQKNVIIAAPELKYRKEYTNYLKSL